MELETQVAHMAKKTTQQLTSKEIEKLLNQQTTVILNAVDQKVGALDQRFNLVDQGILGLRKRLDKMEISINQKIDRLTTTLDRFLKREKLGVVLD